MSTKFYSQPPFLSLPLLLLLPLALIFDSNVEGTVIYWGQDEHEASLSVMCASKNYTIVNIAFLSIFGNGQAPKLNLAGHCDPSASDGCQKLSTDIAYCQMQGIQIMISIGGGGAGSNYTLSSEKDTWDLIEYLWKNFFERESSSSRPLGDVVLDGIDFSIEQGGGESYYAYIARQFNIYSQEGRKVYLSAAPQCRYPDRWLNNALQTGVFDYVWIRFYNNPTCEYSSSDPGKFKKSWDRWTSSIQATKFFLGIPASYGATKSGYIPKNTINNDVLPMIKRSPKYGGIMLWTKYNE